MSEGEGEGGMVQYGAVIAAHIHVESQNVPNTNAVRNKVIGCSTLN